MLVLSRNMGSAELRTAISTFIVDADHRRRHHHSSRKPFAEDPAAADPTAERRQSRGRALLVEDNPINQKVAQSLIKMLGMECDTADNGEIAAEANEGRRTSTWC